MERSMKITCRFGILLGVMGCLVAPPSTAKAQQSGDMFSPTTVASQKLYNPSAVAPDVSTVPALRNLVNNGGKLYYMGERSGIHGWFIVKDQQVQMVYLSPDRQSIMLGALLSSNGENVTGAQVRDLSQKNSEVERILAGTLKEEKAIKNVGVQQEGGAAALEADPGARDAAKAQKGSLPVVSLSPGERLLRDFEVAGGASMGKTSAPLIYMVAAPSCPKCKATWKELAPLVKAGKVFVRLIPIYNTVDGTESNQAAMLLQASDPLTVWDRFVGGDEKALAGTPEEISSKAVISNLNMVAKWNIQGYPYIAYRGKDGRIKIVQGMPERVAAIVTDIGG
jgi:hypothetical protein